MPSSQNSKSTSGKLTANWTKVKQQARQDKNEIVGVEVRDRRHGALGRKLVRQPTQSQRGDEQRRQRTVFQPLARPSAFRRAMRTLRQIDAQLLRGQKRTLPHRSAHFFFPAAG